MSENAERAVLAGGLLLDHAATASPPRSYFFMVHRADLGEDIVGTGYRSEIFHTSEVRRVAGETIRDINAPDYWPGKVVTCVSKAGRFWEGAPKQQDYSSAFQSAARRPSRARASRLRLPEPREGAEGVTYAPLEGPRHWLCHHGGGAPTLSWRAGVRRASGHGRR